MAGSEAEERIRTKVAAELRRRYPEARIVHELVLSTGVSRLDVAAVMPEALIVAEIKSERDTLSRLPAQIAMAHEIADATWVVVAEKHRAALTHMGEAYSMGPERPRKPPLTGMWREHWQNPDYLPGLDRCWRLIEADDGFDIAHPAHWHRHITDPRAVFDVLWAQERRDAIARYGAPVSKSATCAHTHAWAVENMSGAQIRREVCRALRSRSFARADPPMGSES
ncbi:hypothetical protein [Brevundimonas naejangsanensis]|uniref:hypothetical protein n=1 Tax=Brevundimonas naejangsanensis TaxID=588932 RepID=UPI001069980E|nr:hypothetical protein [Brevundimonas naejangsanensis]QBQ49073.1 hypothetical protein E3U41_10495 [Brevundimonas naejangsanensis]